MSDEEMQRSYYAILPANVRYDSKLGEARGRVDPAALWPRDISSSLLDLDMEIAERKKAAGDRKAARFVQLAFGDDRVIGKVAVGGEPCACVEIRRKRGKGWAVEQCLGPDNDPRLAHPRLVREALGRVLSEMGGRA